MDQLDFVVIAYGEGLWGRGKDMNEALANYKKMGGSLSFYIVAIAPPGTYIDDGGCFCYPPGSKFGAQTIYQYQRKKAKKR